MYLPAGSGWYDFYTGKYLTGGERMNTEAPLGEIPLFVREGSIIPSGPEIQYAEEKTNGGITLHVYAGKDGRFTLYEDENNKNDYQKGIYSTVEFKWDQANQTLTIGKRRGEFPGMVKDRTFNVVVVSPEHATGFDAPPAMEKSVMYDGSEKVVSF